MRRPFFACPEGILRGILAPLALQSFYCALETEPNVAYASACVTLCPAGRLPLSSCGFSSIRFTVDGKRSTVNFLSRRSHMNRRKFIGTSVAATLAAKTSFAGGMPKMVRPIGVQLYTVRDAMKSDFEGTVAKVAATGYKEVEFAGYFDHSPKDVRAILDKNGLAAPSCHVGYDVVEKKWSEALDAAKIVGHGYIICPWIDEKQRKEPDGWKRAADLFNRAGEASKKAGIQFGYHNHSFEFDPADSLGGKLPYDFLLAETDP